MLCSKTVVNINCPYCQSAVIKYGRTAGKQRLRCISCKRTFLQRYKQNARNISINSNVAMLVKEGCGIRSTGRILNIAPATVIKRIKQIADGIKKPPIIKNRVYEIDELKTYVGNKKCDCWVIYAIDRESRQVVDLKVGRRNKKNIKQVTDTLLLADCKKVYSDKLDLYRLSLPEPLHQITRYGTNRIERRNLTLRTHIKRLNRKTIAYSKKTLMLEACLKIYFWYR